MLDALERTFADRDRTAFESVLYSAIKTSALSYCQPKVATAKDAETSLSSQSINETSSEAELFEYQQLHESILSDFETFLANSKIGESGDASESTEVNKDPLSRLATNLGAVCPKVRTPCGHIFKENEPTFRCKDCSTDHTCVLCRTCFFASIHANHRYKMHGSGGGYCDCGDEEAWTSGAWCRIHAADVDEESGEEPPISADNFRSVEEDQDIEMKRMRSRLADLPVDVVRRCTYLLQPLISSASAVLFELLQGSPRTTFAPLSLGSREPECGLQEKCDFDIPEAVEHWPPTLNHLPCTSIAQDASILGVGSFPHTVPLKSDSKSLHNRCLAQQSRAHWLHPALFDPAPADGDNSTEKNYAVVLYNNEYHNYEDVIKAVRRLDGCSSVQATLFAIIVNRDGRTPLLTHLTSSAACAKASQVSHTRHLIRPLRAAAMDYRVYALENFFVSVLRWLERLATKVLTLRPIICSAMLGRFPSDVYNVGEVINVPGETMLPDSLLAHILERFTLSHRGVRKTSSRLITGVLLQELYYKRIFAIEFTRHYDDILQAYIYDDHLLDDSLFALSCQIYTVPCLVRHLLREQRLLLCVFSRLASTIANNSLNLPAFYEPLNSTTTLLSLFSPNPPVLPALLDLRVTALRDANREAWNRVHSILQKGNSAELRVFTWRHVFNERPEFNPFERIFTTTNDLRYILTSLLNLRPLTGEWAVCSEGWWDVDSKQNFLTYFRRFLDTLCYLQDMNGMQRAVQVHVEVEQEWISTFNILSNLITVISLTVQVVSSNRDLFFKAIDMAHEAYERRVGLIDRCFRVKHFNGPYRSATGIDRWTVQCLGASSVIYEYDVSAFLISVMQPLPQLLASLYGHALEMGISPNKFGLKDKEFANLVIERPLQVIAFIAQCSANLWVRNGLVIQHIILNMHDHLRTEMIDRHYQLIQQAAAVLPADELIVRMIHKLDLRAFMCDSRYKDKTRHISSVIALLRTILYLVAHRFRDGVGYFDPKLLTAAHASPCLFPEKLQELDEALEVNHGQLIDDVVHRLCIKPMAYSELLANLPRQPLSCLLRTPPPYLPADYKEDKQPIFRGSQKETIERPLSKILRQIATPSSVGSKQVFLIKPEVILSRFNRFYHGYTPSVQTAAEENVFRVLKKWLVDEGNHVTKNCPILPIPPVPPCPRRRFIESMEKPLLQLVRCSTFVRMIRHLLDLELADERVQQDSSETLIALVLHVIIVALYEDAISFTEKGERPFLYTVARVPNNAESCSELETLAASRHWTREPAIAPSPPFNCLLPRLALLLERNASSRNSDLIRWTLKLWEVVAANPEDKILPIPMDVATGESISSKDGQRTEAMRKRQAKIMERMSQMQRNFLSSHYNEIIGLEEENIADTPSLGGHSDEKSDEPLSSLSAVGPHRADERIRTLRDPSKRTVTCVMCLEEMPESDGHDMVVSAYGSRSNVISRPLPHGQIVDFLNETSQSDCTEDNLTAISTSAVAASLGFNEVNLPHLPHMLHGVVTPSEGDSISQVASSSFRPVVSGSSMKKRDLDPWFPRPLVSSRSPIGEEGTFVSVCPHLMHVKCKDQYAAQLKRRSTANYRQRPAMYEFRCSLCRSLSNFDVPLFGRLQDAPPADWVSRCLKKPFDLTDWLRTLHTWLSDCPLPRQASFSLSMLLDAPESFDRLFDVLTCNQSSNSYDNVDDILAQIFVSCGRSFETDAVMEESTSADCSSSSHSRRPGLTRFLRVPSKYLSPRKSAVQCSSTHIIPLTPLLHRPLEDPAKATGNLWVLVQRLATLSQPKPIKALQTSALNTRVIGVDNFEAELFLTLNGQPENFAVLDVNFGDGEDLDVADYSNGEDSSDSTMDVPLAQPSPTEQSSKINSPIGQGSSDLPPSLSEIAEELHTCLASCYSHLKILSGISPSDRQPMPSFTRLRAALVCAHRRSLQTVFAAACEWRTLRHSVAYTLVVWERYLRHIGPNNHFFNGKLAERHKTGLGYLLRAAFHAHARIAPVARMTPATRPWSQQRNNPSWWWWHCYFAPKHQEHAVECCYSATLKVANLIQNVTRIAVTQDAARLWRLLLPDSQNLIDSTTLSSQDSSLSGVDDSCCARKVDDSPVSPSDRLNQSPLSPDALNVPASLLWEVDITFLFLNLLFLRPGLESDDQKVDCQYISKSTVTKGTSGGECLQDIVCDEGFPRFPIGDAHEAFTLRLCYLALLVQALLSWKPSLPNQRGPTPSVSDQCAVLWMNEKLLAVRRRLQHLSDLPVCSVESTPAVLYQLFAHIHSHCLPFLRIAAFAIQQITDVDVPPDLVDPSAEMQSNEFSLLLTYLGLPQSPLELFVLLSDDDTSKPPSSPINTSSQIDEVSASSSLWLASLMTSWCLLGRGAVSKKLYRNYLRPIYLPCVEPSPILPEPDIRIPRLIQLPRDFVSLMALATELKTVHTGSNIHSDPSLCLVCGAVACFACYSCRGFEYIAGPMGEQGTPHREAVVYDMQAHARGFHSGYAVVMLFTGRVFLFSEQARRTTELPSPYRDEFGETDIGLRRGNPLFLDEKAYLELNDIWLGHRMNSATTSNTIIV